MENFTNSVFERGGRRIFAVGASSAKGNGTDKVLAQNNFKEIGSQNDFQDGVLTVWMKEVPGVVSVTEPYLDSVIWKKMKLIVR